MTRDSDETARASRQSYVAVAAYNSPAEVESAISELERSGFNILKLNAIDPSTGEDCDRWGHQRSELANIEFSEGCFHRYESASRVERSILVAEWTEDEVVGGREEIDRTHPESVDEY